MDEPRHVRVQKGVEPLGISIGGGESGGIFVSKVMAGSIAQQAGLEYGDQLLEVRFSPMPVGKNFALWQILDFSCNANCSALLPQSSVQFH